MASKATGRAATGNHARFTLDDVRATYKRRDAWWTVFLVDPIASRLVVPIANHTNITPNQVSFMSLVFGLLAAAAFAEGDHRALLVGAVLYHVSFVLDCVDGKVARLKGTGSIFGMWLDYSFDRYRVLACTCALMYGQYHRTGEVRYIWLAVIVTFLDMLRYMDALQFSKLRSAMNTRLRTSARPPRKRQLRYTVPDGVEAHYSPVGGVRDQGFHFVPTAVPIENAVYGRRRRTRVDLHSEFRSRFTWWPPVRDFLMRRRVRPHLFSGIEYQMFIFIVGPVLDAVAELVVVSAVLLLLFEGAIIYKLLLSSRDFERAIQKRSSRLGTGTAVTAAATDAGAVDAARSAVELEPGIPEMDRA